MAKEYIDYKGKSCPLLEAGRAADTKRNKFMMERVNNINLQLIHSALTHFIGVPVMELKQFEDNTIMFKTHFEEIGFVEPGRSGMNVIVLDKLVYEIEKELYDILTCDKSDIGLIEFYNRAKNMDLSLLQKKSLEFFNIVKTSTENIILNNKEVPLEGDTVIDGLQIHYTKDKRIKINLN